MSQQEFMPQGKQDQDEQSLDAEQFYAQPLPGRRKTREMPKNDHPSTFDQSIPPYTYRAQDTAQSAHQPETKTRTAQQEQQARRRDFSPDGDAFETGYRPYRHSNWRQQVPRWARPQHNKFSLPKWIIFLVLAFVLLPAIPALIHALLILFGILAFIVLLPFIVIFALIIAFVVLLALVLVGVPIYLSRSRRALNGRGKTWWR